MRSADGCSPALLHAQVRGTQDVDLEFSDIKLAGQVCLYVLPLSAPLRPLIVDLLVSTHYLGDAHGVDVKRNFWHRRQTAKKAKQQMRSHHHRVYWACPAMARLVVQGYSTGVVFRGLI